MTGANAMTPKFVTAGRRTFNLSLVTNVQWQPGLTESSPGVAAVVWFNGPGLPAYLSRAEADDLRAALAGEGCEGRDNMLTRAATDRRALAEALAALRQCTPAEALAAVRRARKAREATE